jgi:hypothetical protein
MVGEMGHRELPRMRLRLQYPFIECAARGRVSGQAVT